MNKSRKICDTEKSQKRGVEKVFLGRPTKTFITVGIRVKYSLIFLVNVDRLWISNNLHGLCRIFIGLYKTIRIL